MLLIKIVVLVSHLFTKILSSEKEIFLLKGAVWAFYGFAQIQIMYKSGLFIYSCKKSNSWHL